MDVVKTRLQAQSSAPSTTQALVSTAKSFKTRYRGTLDAFVKIGSQEGISGLWRGLGPAVVMTVPSTTIYFALYECFKAEIEERTAQTSYWMPLLAGSAARAMAVATTSPIDLFRTNLQSHARDVGSMQLFRDIVKSGRWSTFWVGVRPTLWRDVPFSGIYWMCYEALRAEIVRSRMTNSNYMTSLSAGAIAGSIAGILTLPFDVLKTRTQMNVDRMANGSMTRSHLPTSTFAHMAEICAKEGVGALFQGLLPRIGKVAPACAIMISSYELVKDFFITRRLNSEPLHRRQHNKALTPPAAQPSQQPNR
jgi:solute carrier family 25 protein 39/40